RVEEPERAARRGAALAGEPGRVRQHRARVLRDRDVGPSAPAGARVLRDDDRAGLRRGRACEGEDRGPRDRDRPQPRAPAPARAAARLTGAEAASLIAAREEDSRRIDRAGSAVESPGSGAENMNRSIVASSLAALAAASTLTFLFP